MNVWDRLYSWGTRRQAKQAPGRYVWSVRRGRQVYKLTVDGLRVMVRLVDRIGCEVGLWR